MRKIYKIVLAILVAGSFALTASAQQGYWTSRTDKSGIITDRLVERATFPTEFKLFDLNTELLRQQLFTITDNRLAHATVITLPNTTGGFEDFEVVEASNFEPALQARFPQIRAFSGRGITDKGAQLKLSISPQGIQTMIIRTNGRPMEFIEPYSKDHTVYAVFISNRSAARQFPWTCSTQEQHMAEGINAQLNNVHRTESNNGQLKTMRLAQSCTGEYANFFGASTAGTPADQAIVLTAYNNTMTRCNGLYEKDLALHLNLVANTTAVIFYNPATDPYATVTNPLSPPGSWNSSLQSTLTNIIGEANYDIGHLFGASGGGGNAGCIGCVCDDGIKGSGITSPATGTVNSSPAFPPSGDGFDIDYVAHEIGHQLGATHTYTFQSEGGPLSSSTQREVASGITIMGYAGITPWDVAPHSIDIFHETSIEQIQSNLATKTCPITTNITPNNATPVIGALTNFTIPISTPFALTGFAIDANPGDVLTYCWEQNDPTLTQQFFDSPASPAKPNGPNWLSFSPTTNPTRLCPELPTILAGNSVTGPLTGGDPGIDIEALSSIGRTLNFRLTVRDNHPYSSTPPVAVAQTAFADMAVTVDATTGPFLITSQNAAVSYTGGSTQTVTWSVNGTTGAPINCANVKISWSTDNGATFTTLVASTANDGTETFTVPSIVTTQGRIKVEAVGNIFFDINNAAITVPLPANGYTFGTPTNGTAACPAAGPITATLPVNFQGTYTGPVTVAYLSGAPAGTTVSVSPASFTANGTATVSLNGTGALAPGTYNVTVQGTGPAPGITQTAVVSFTVNPGSGPVITTQPVDISTCAGTSPTFSIAAATGTYQWQVSTTAVPAFTDIPGATAATLSLSTVAPAMSGYQYRCVVTGLCGTTISNVVTLTVRVRVVVSEHPVSQSVCAGNGLTFSVTGSGTPPFSYQWQVRSFAAPGFVNITGATASTFTLVSTTPTMNGFQYRCVLTNSCGIVTSNPATLSVSSNVTISIHPADQNVCEGTNLSFIAEAFGAGIAYQWEISRAGGAYTTLIDDGIHSGTNSATLTITGVPPGFNGNRYRCIANSGVCSPGITNGALLTVNTFPAINTQPASIAVCDGAAANFSAAATTGVGTLTYQWQLSTDGGVTYNNIPGATTASFTQATVPVGQNGYRFRVIVTAGCGSVTSNAAILTVNPYPVISFGPPYIVCKSDAAFTLSATPAGGTFSGSGISGTSFVPAAAGTGPKAITYTVTTAGCQSAITRTIQVNECAERHLTLSEYPAVIVYPVPNNGQFSIRLNTDLYTTLNIKVYNSLGQLIKTQVASGLAFGSVIPVSLNNVPGGTYQLFLSNDERGEVSTKGRSIIVYRK